jgi:hypothetical protein
VLDPPLHLRNDVPGIALEPMPIEGFGHEAKLDNEIVGEVLRLGLAALNWRPNSRKSRTATAELA